MLLLEGKANLKGCGTLTMPTADAMIGAETAMFERLLAVREVDLSGMSNVKGVRRTHHLKSSSNHLIRHAPV